MRGSATLGARRHQVSVYQVTKVASPDPGEPKVDALVPLSPATWFCSIDPATTRDLERVSAGTVTATASHILRGRYHPAITTQTRILFGTRILDVTGVSNLEERSIDMEVVAVEKVA